MSGADIWRTVDGIISNNRSRRTLATLTQINALNEQLNKQLNKQLNELPLNSDAINWKEDGKTALYCAAKYGQVEIVEKLLQKNPNVNATDNKGKTALWVAVEHNHAAVVVLLLNVNGIDANLAPMHGSSKHITPLQYAQTKGYSRIIKLLNTHQGTTDHETTRITATHASPGHSPSPSRSPGLIPSPGPSHSPSPGPSRSHIPSHSPSPGPGPSHIHTPSSSPIIIPGIHFSTDNKLNNFMHIAVVSYLRITSGRKSTDPEFLIPNMEKPYIHQLINNKGQEIIPNLTTGVYSNVNNENLCWLIMNSKITELNAKNSDGRTPLHLAVFNITTPIESSLSDIILNYFSQKYNLRKSQSNDQNINFNEKDVNGDTPLHLACKNNIYMSNLIIWARDNRYDIDINAVNNDKCTPLWLACSNGNVGAVTQLLEHEPIPKKLKASGRTQIGINLAAHRRTPLEEAKHQLNLADRANKRKYQHIINLLEGKFFAKIRSFIGRGGSFTKRKTKRKSSRKNKTVKK